MPPKYGGDLIYRETYINSSFHELQLRDAARAETGEKQMSER